MKILYWILIAYGMMNIIVYSQIFLPIREKFVKIPFLYELINCPMCSSFWIGIFLSLVVYSPSTALFFNFNTTLPFILLSCFIDGLLASGSVYFINTLVEKMER